MSYKKLIDGFHLFKRDYYQSDKSESYKNLIEQGQKPEMLVLACSDSRIDPAILTNSDPGEFFAIRNVAALVPPYNNGGLLHGTSSAIEYAVRHLGVKHIIILGHAECGGAKALAKNDFRATDNHNFQFLHHWLDIGKQAKENVFGILKNTDEEKKIRALEQALILTSMANLLSFPWIKTKCDRSELQIHGWYFDMKEGNLLEYDTKKEQFCTIGSDSITDNPPLNTEPNLENFLQNYTCPNCCSS